MLPVNFLSNPPTFIGELLCVGLFYISKTLVLTVNITNRNKSLFFESWFNSNILLVKQLFNCERFLYSYEDFIAKYSVLVSQKTVINALSTGIECSSCCL